MFVLSRRPGESIVVGESTALTVGVVGNESADVLIRTADVPTGRLMTLRIGRPERIEADVDVLLIRCGAESVKIGVESPRHVAVQRIDA